MRTISAACTCYRRMRVMPLDKCHKNLNHSRHKKPNKIKIKPNAKALHAALNYLMIKKRQACRHQVQVISVRANMNMHTENVNVSSSFLASSATTT